MKRIIQKPLALLLTAVLVLGLLPTAVLAAEKLSAKPYFENPDAGPATPASSSGATAAVPYTYSEVPLYGGDSPWFSGGTAPISFEAVFIAPSGIGDYGTVDFSPSAAPYIRYTPSAEVAGETVTFKVKASAEGAASVTGDFVWTVNVAAQPTDGSSNANLSALSYTLGGDEAVAIPGFSANIMEYDVTLPNGTAFPQTATLSGTVEDTDKASISSQTAATVVNYMETSASITVTAENGATTKTYTVNFRIAPPEEAPSVFIGDSIFKDGDTISLTIDEEKKLTISLGSGTFGAVSAAYKSSNWETLALNTSFEGVYPNVIDRATLKLTAAASVDLTISFYDVKQSEQRDAEPTSTMTLHIVADGKAVNASTAEAFASALGASGVEQINVTGSFAYDGAIDKEVAIHVQNGSTLTLNYATGSVTKVSTVCNADITVEDGGTIKFSNVGAVGNSNSCCMVINGSFTLNAGAKASTYSYHLPGNLLFQGGFTNKGSFDVAKGNAYVPYGTSDTGTFTTDSVCYNLCIATPTKTSTDDPQLYITGVAGTVAIGEKLHPILDGLGEIAAAIPGWAFTWGDSSNGGSTYEYTVPPSKAGSAITVRVNGSPLNASYAYFLVDGTTVTKVTTPDATGYTTAKVNSLSTVYLGGAAASDGNSGASADKAVATISTALSALADGGKVVLCGDAITTANGFLSAKGAVTITNTDGTNIYPDAVLTLNDAQFPSGNITFKNIRLAKGTAGQSGALVPVANNTSLVFDGVTATGSSGAPISLSIQNAYSYTGGTAVVKNCTMQLSTLGIETLTLDHATVISNFDSRTPLGSVSLTNASTLITPQIIDNLTSDDSDNALALFSEEGKPVAVTVNGMVTIAQGKPIALLRYTGDGYGAFTAGGLTLLTSAAENTSLTADKFLTMDTVNYSLKKDGNSIVTAQNILVTFHPGGGTCDTATMPVDSAGRLASLPTPERGGSYRFDGWYSLETGGVKITAEHVFTQNTTVYARWTYTGSSSGGGSGSSTKPPVVETLPDGTAIKTELTTKTDSATGAKVVQETVSTTKPDGTVTKVETIAISGGRDGVTADVTTEVSVTGEKTVVGQVSAKDGETSVKLPAAVVEAATGDSAAAVSVGVTVGGVALTFDAKTLEALRKTAATPTISVTPAAAKNLPEEIRATATAYDFTVGGKGIDFGGGIVTVSIVYAKKDDAKTVAVYFVAEDGSLARAAGTRYQNGTVSFPQSHWSTYAIVEETALPFADVAEGDWYYEAVRYVFEHKLFSGTSATAFSPDAPMTRAMLMTVLARLDGQNTTIGATWDEVGMRWAKEKGISDGTNPAGNITREQLVAMLYRYAGSPETSGTLDGFPDADTAGSFATGALRWAVDKGILSGKGSGFLDPKGKATRAEVATILLRFIQNSGK